MPETLLAVFCVALALAWYFSHRNVKRQLQEYMELFEVADSHQKEAQAKVEHLLMTTHHKDITMERGSQALELANNKISELELVRVEQVEALSGLSTAVEFQEEQYAKILSQKKSSEVRTGKIAEQIAPFLEDYPLDPRTARFIGDPIDFVHFDPEMVTFVEVKSGKSQLSKKQRQIRDLIKAGKVEFTIYRVEGK